MVSSPGTGHFTSSLELANRLVSLHGVQVSFFTTNTTTHSSSFPPGLRLITLPPVDMSKMALTDNGLLTHISILLRHSLPSIQSSIVNSSPPPKVLIVDEFSTDAFEIAESLSMKMYLLVTMNAIELAFMAYLPTLDRDIKTNYRLLSEPLRVPGCKPVPIEYLNDSFRDRESQSYKIFLQHARKFVKASGILVNTFHDLESQTIDALTEDGNARQIPIPPVYPVGPLINTSNRPSFDSNGDGDGDGGGDGEYLTWLDKQPRDSVVYVSFGSGGTLSTAQITELAWGLEMSQQRFLWVVRAPQDKVDSAYFNPAGNGVNEPGDYLPDGFLDRIRDMGLVVPNWATQIEILHHKSVGGFFSHCGWNSTLESIIYGVPLIAFPLFAEQRLNAFMIAEDAKVAVKSEITPSEGLVRREEIERMVRLVMDTEEGKRLRNRAKELKESAMRGLAKGGSSYNSLSKVVKIWKTDDPSVG